MMADMFALGVIIFILHTGREPFEMAKSDDNLYKCFVHNQHKLFWTAHERVMGA